MFKIKPSFTNPGVVLRLCRFFFQTTQEIIKNHLLALVHVMAVNSDQHQAFKKGSKSYHRMSPIYTCCIFQVFWGCTIGFGEKQTEM